MGEPRWKADNWSKDYMQEADCCDTEPQVLQIQQQDGGGGPYWVLTTERWAIDSIAELVALLRSAGVAETADENKTEPRGV